MEHNFIKGLGITLLAYLLMQVIAYSLLGSEVYQEDLWPAFVLWIFVLLYSISVGYSLTQSYDASLFEYAKDVSDGFMMGFLFHYTSFWKASLIYFFIAWLHRLTSIIIRTAPNSKK